MEKTPEKTPKKKYYSKVEKVENKEDKRFPRMKRFAKSKLDEDQQDNAIPDIDANFNLP